MPINPLIPLSVQPVDLVGAQQNALQTAALQNDLRGQEQNMQAQQMDMETARIGQQEAIDKLAAMKEDREFQSVVQGAYVTKQLLGAGNVEGAKDFLLKRRDNILAKGGNPKDTEALLADIESGNMEGLSQKLDSAVAIGTHLGLIKEGAEPTAQMRNFEYAQGLDPAQRAEFLAGSGGQSSAPSNVQEWEFFSKLSPEKQQQYMSMKRAGSGFDVGGVPYYRQPGGSTEQLATPEQVAANEANTTTANERAKLDVKQEAAAPQDLRRAQASMVHIDNVLREAFRIDPKIDWTTTGPVGAISAALLPLDARAVKQSIETIKANIGFDRLQEMRDFSKTGGALGQVAVQELDALRNSIASLDTGLDPKTLKENVGVVIQTYQNLSAIMGALTKDAEGRIQGAAPSAGRDPQEFRDAQARRSGSAGQRPPPESGVPVYERDESGRLVRVQ